MSDVLLCNTGDANKIVIEARSEWIDSVLSDLGISIGEIDKQNISALRGELMQHGILVDYNIATEEVNIYKCSWHSDQFQEGWLPPETKNIIAQWKRPSYIKKIEGRDIYYEIHLNKWSFKKTK